MGSALSLISSVKETSCVYSHFQEIKLPRRPFLPRNPPRALAPALLEVQLLLASLIPPQHVFPEGINGAHTEVGSEEALRTKSHCATEELMLFFQE